MEDLKDLNARQVLHYLGVTDNDNYMYQWKQLKDFRLLEKLTRNYENRQICLKEDFGTYVGDKNSKIIYEYEDLVVFV